MRSRVTGAPAQEPVTLAEAKASLRITTTDEDTLVTQYLEDARIYAERITGRKLITQTVTSFHNGFDEKKDDYEPGFRRGLISQAEAGQTLELDFSPVQSVTSLSQVQSDNSEVVVSASQYYLDNFDDDMRSYLRSQDGITDGTRSTNSIKVIYVAGYGDNPSDVPSALRRAIIAMVGYLYTNRGDCDMGTCAGECGADKMLKGYILESLR